MPFDPSVVSNPFAALSFIAAPAVLTNAASVLAMSTSNRFLRASDRMRFLADRLDRGTDSDAMQSMFRVQVHRVEKQSVLLLHGLFGAYTALGSFAAASLISILGAVLAVATERGAHLAVIMALIAGFTGVCGLVFSTINLFHATRLSMLNIMEEAALIRQRHGGRERLTAGDKCTHYKVQSPPQLMSRTKFLKLTPPLYDYVCAQRTGAADPLLERLRIATDALGDISRMQMSREQGSFLTILTAAIGARRVIELGTFTGYSALCFARALPADGRLLCLDLSDEWTAVGRPFWREAGVNQKIELRIGPAAEQLRKLDPTEQFDLAFVNADKTGYDRYYELLLPRLKPNGLILFDNMLYGGDVLTPDGDPDTEALHALNRKLATDPRVEAVLLPFADGIQICRKR